MQFFFDIINCDLIIFLQKMEMDKYIILKDKVYGTRIIKDSAGKEHTLYRIQRLSDGLIGGWIENYSNLSQFGNCFVHDESMVYEDIKNTLQYRL